jgi:hypothetical protein
MKLLRCFQRAWVRFLFAVGGSRFVKVHPLPELPAGCAYAVYKQKSDPRWLMVCVKHPDGSLVPMHRTETWEPSDDWTFEKLCDAGGKPA